MLRELITFGGGKGKIDWRGYNRGCTVYHILNLMLDVREDTHKKTSSWSVYMISRGIPGPKFRREH